MCLLTPKISWITTTAPRGLPDGSARYAASLWPSAAFSSIMLAMRPPPEKPAVRIAIMKKNARELFHLAKQALLNAGAHETMADAAAQHLVRAEAQGLPTHGMSRVPFYCSMLRNGRADGAAHPALVGERAGACLTHTRDGLPYVSVEWALAELIQRARRNAVAFAGIRNSAHVGVLGIHLLAVARRG